MMIRLRTILGSFWDALWMKETLVALIFLLALIVFECIVLTVPLRLYVTKIAQREFAFGLGGLFLVLISWLWALAFFRASLTASGRVKIFCFLMFALAVFFEYGYQNAFSRFSSVEDLRVALFDATSEQRRGSIAAYLDWRAALPAVVYGALLFKFRATRRASWKPIALVLAVFAIFFSSISSFTNGQFPTVSLDAFLRTAVLSPWKWASGYHGPREQVFIHRQLDPKNNVVFVVDESIRGDHLGINGYQRNTTPYLAELQTKGWLYNSGIASSGGTCSEKSDSLLFTGMTPADLPDTTFEIRRRPNLFQYAKAAGYKTIFLDGQKETYWLGTSYDRQYIDDWKPSSTFQGAENFDLDAVIGKKIASLVNNSTGQFIFVIKRGVHYPYVANFPATAAEWQPVDTVETEIDPARKEQLVNTYDNALKYNLESFFLSLNVEHWQNKTVLVYTSDHGQTLSEHGERHTHCGTASDTAPTEANVPIFIVRREALLIDSAYRPSHANLFATLLDLMNFPKEDRRYAYATSLLEAKAADSRQRFFWVGDFSNLLLNGRVPFDR